jgi:hypothetical protein
VYLSVVPEALTVDNKFSAKFKYGGVGQGCTNSGHQVARDTKFCTVTPNTGRFIMYSGITNMYYKKTVGHIVTKPVQMEGTTQHFFPSKLFLIVVHIFAMRVYVLGKWPPINR